MFYNLRKEKVNGEIDCITCPYHDNNTNKCSGFGKCCFAMDDISGALIDPLTDKPLTDSAIENIKISLKEEE